MTSSDDRADKPDIFTRLASNTSTEEGEKELEAQRHHFEQEAQAEQG